ncbi:DUF1837 domain-containing protein [Pseudomonas ogarae]|uniref:HamA C-terminal domain-containing protein n=1 Tax=Pseudomonas ogarae (strain DSM 112162 / CECT 30235 / F113) TaxID=1114970 RepID=UPI0016495CD2|nr:DUF1837 domain-containing protein [Pseudomonas zarinae]QXH95912.1 DUF1837 domain-containing protein [Pseudomonas zarinae]
MNPYSDVPSQQKRLEEALAAFQRDYSILSPRIRTLTYTPKCDLKKVTLRLHFPALRQGNATVSELVDSIYQFIVPFCLPRSDVQRVRDQYGIVSVDEFMIKTSRLEQQAVGLFKRAHRLTNRNGEAGELLLYILTEWLLAAPQLLAKMSLKTNPEMPIHGSDGVHVRYCSTQSKLLLYWGESKLYSDIGDAINSAVKSIEKSLSSTSLDHEIELVKRYIDFSNMEENARNAILSYLDPFDENYNERQDIITCLIGFDFEKFSQIAQEDDPEDTFRLLAEKKLEEISVTLTNTLQKRNLEHKEIEFFFFPVPSVQELRNLFQKKIGWND